MVKPSFVDVLGKIEARLLPRRIVRALQIPREKRALASLEQRRCAVSTLRSADDATVKDWLAADLTFEWRQAELKLAGIKFGSAAGAVNVGDRRALYYLAKALRPNSILEVGTHVGASTSMLALALMQLNATPSGAKPRFVTVDIVDVNDPIAGAWKRSGCSHSPADVIRAVGCEDLVTFVTSPSLPYFRSCKDQFDLIFLDGDHHATTVYRELPAAVQVLNPGGIILLHDYFPDLKPLWSDNAVIPGPDLAITRLRRENVPIAARPFGALPWPTKLGSNVSSLAVVCRTE
jgi:predicted O-methyltransferase YrrM